MAAALAAQPGRRAGCHPPNPTADAAKLGKDEVLAELAGLAAQPSVVAVGETGLDYYRDHAPPEVQQEWFRAHIQIAKDTGKALVIHDREAHDDVLRLLASEGAPDQVVFHCFSGGAELARACAHAGYVMSFAGNVTFPSAQPLRDAAAVAPANLILVETDALPHAGANRASGAQPYPRTPCLHRAEGHGHRRAVRRGHRDWRPRVGR